MRVYTLRRELWIPHPVSAVFDFFSRAENLEQITPPWMRFKILAPLQIQMRERAAIQYTRPGNSLSLVDRNRAMESTSRICRCPEEEERAVPAVASHAHVLTA